MGGETPPEQLFKAVLQAAEHYPSPASFLVFTSQSVADAVPPHPRIQFQVVNELITMGDEPLSAIRHKKGASLLVGMRLLKRKQIQAFVTIGNTGALIAASSLILRRQPGIKRPALLTELPTVKDSMVIVDVGGNVACKAEHLVQFATLGVAYQRKVNKLPHPRVGLLNIGIESKKGTLEYRQAYQLLQEQTDFAFAGNIEGREIFEGKVDVLVTDGFTGNVLLKSVEGISTFMLNTLKSMSKDPQILNELTAYFHHEEYPGAIVAGVEGTVVKCHGSSSPRALFNGICGAAAML